MTAAVKLPVHVKPKLLRIRVCHADQLHPGARAQRPPGDRPPLMASRQRGRPVALIGEKRILEEEAGLTPALLSHRGTLVAQGTLVQDHRRGHREALAHGDGASDVQYRHRGSPPNMRPESEASPGTVGPAQRVPSDRIGRRRARHLIKLIAEHQVT